MKRRRLTYLARFQEVWSPQDYQETSGLSQATKQPPHHARNYRSTLALRHSTAQGTSALGGVCPAQQLRGCWVRVVRLRLASPERQPVGP